MINWIASRVLDSRKRQSIFVFLFFVVVIALSLGAYQDFGAYTDQPNSQRHLRVTLKKYFNTFGLLEKAPQKVQDAEDFDNYEYRYYGVAPQYPLVLLEYLAEKFKMSSSRYWHLRDLYVRVIFILAGVFFYLILKKITTNNVVIFIGLLLFFLHPRIAAHSFYNMKDSIFLSFLTCSTYFLLNAIRKPSTSNILWLAFFSAITINVRMMGVLVPVYFGLSMLWEYKYSLQEGIKKLLVFVAGFSLTSLAIWPLLWDSPVATFSKVFIHFSNYTPWKGTNIYNGELVMGDKLPITYIPTWIMISSPYAHLVVFLLGLLFTTFLCLKKNELSKESKQCALVCLFVVLMSYLAIIFFKSTLYGDWRHLHYLFVPLLLLGLIGLNYISGKYHKLFIILNGVILLSLLATCYWMVANHPHYYVYFNSFAGKKWNARWDGDSWNLATKQLLEELLRKDLVKGKRLKFMRNYCISTNLAVIPSEFKDKIKIVDDIKDADYVVGNHRNVIGDYPTNYVEGFKEYLTVVVDGNKIKTLFKREAAISN